MSKYKDLIDKARSSEDEPENQQTRKPDKSDFANLSIKILKTHRQFWVSRAKAEGTTITAVIIEALEKRFGKPN